MEHANVSSRFTHTAWLQVKTLYVSSCMYFILYRPQPLVDKWWKQDKCIIVYIYHHMHTPCVQLLSLYLWTLYVFVTSSWWPYCTVFVGRKPCSTEQLVDVCSTSVCSYSAPCTVCWWSLSCNDNFHLTVVLLVKFSRSGLTTFLSWLVWPLIFIHTGTQCTGCQPEMSKVHVMLKCNDIHINSLPVSGYTGVWCIVLPTSYNSSFSLSIS